MLLSTLLRNIEQGYPGHGAFFFFNNHHFSVNETRLFSFRCLFFVCVCVCLMLHDRNSRIQITCYYYYHIHLLSLIWNQTKNPPYPKTGINQTRSLLQKGKRKRDTRRKKKFFFFPLWLAQIKNWTVVIHSTWYFLNPPTTLSVNVHVVLKQNAYSLALPRNPKRFPPDQPSYR